MPNRTPEVGRNKSKTKYAPAKIGGFKTWIRPAKLINRNIPSKNQDYVWVMSLKIMHAGKGPPASHEPTARTVPAPEVPQWLPSVLAHWRVKPPSRAKQGGLHRVGLACIAQCTRRWLTSCSLPPGLAWWGLLRTASEREMKGEHNVMKHLLMRECERVRNQCSGVEVQCGGTVVTQQPH